MCLVFLPKPNQGWLEIKNQHCHICVGEQKKVSLPATTMIRRLKSQAGCPKKGRLNQKLLFPKPRAKQAEPHCLCQ